MKKNKISITAVVLAGGQGSRMGGTDKGLTLFWNIPLVEYVIERIAPQVGETIINANRNMPIYANYGLRVVNDQYSGSYGPLAGFAAGLAAAETPYLATVPCDSPFIPHNLVERLFATLKEKEADIAVVETNQKLQPVFSLINVSLLKNLSQFIDQGGRKIDRWYEQVNMVRVDFSDQAECFYNINTLEELKTLEKKQNMPS